MPAGRPSEFTPELAANILGQLADGKTLTAICKADDMPSRVTVWNWTRQNSEFLNAYREARKGQAEAWSDDMVDLSDGTGDVNRDKLRIQTRQWLMARQHSQRWGDKVSQEISGPDGGPIQTDDLALARWLALVLTKAQPTGDK
jgi:hypothetical protein